MIRNVGLHHRMAFRHARGNLQRALTCSQFQPTHSFSSSSNTNESIHEILQNIKQRSWSKYAAMGAVMGGAGAAATWSAMTKNEHEKEDTRTRKRVLPPSHFRSCCAGDMYIETTTGPCKSHNCQSRKHTPLPPPPNLLATTASTSTTSNEVPESCTLETLPSILTSIVGSSHVYTPTQTSNGMMDTFCRGARLGHGTALAVVQPGSLTEAVQCLRCIVAAGAVVLPQGSNTGLTGGSVPRRDTQQQQKHRPAVILSTKRLKSILPVDKGTRVLCHPGVGLGTLSTYCQQTFARESHSILGSLFLNPSVAAGIAFNSGGTQLRKGPAYTERALYAKVLEDGKTVEVVNELGLELLDPPKTKSAPASLKEEEVLRLLDRTFQNQTTSNTNNSNPIPSLSSSKTNPHATNPSHSTTYPTHVCNLTSQPSRYNADTTGPCYNRCEGKVLLLASIHSTFAKPLRTKTFWISFEEFEQALEFRSQVCLVHPSQLPISLEYMNGDAFQVVNKAGRALAYLTYKLGVGDLMGQLWNLKLYIEGLWFVPYAEEVCDWMLFWGNGFFPRPLPLGVMKMGKRKKHHVILQVGEYEKEENGEGYGEEECGSTLEERMEAFLKSHNYNNNENDDNDGNNAIDAVEVYECSTTHPKEGNEVALVNSFRFAAAPAFRTWCVGRGVQGVSVDYALPKNGGIPPVLPESVDAKKKSRMKDQDKDKVKDDTLSASNEDKKEHKAQETKKEEEEHNTKTHKNVTLLPPITRMRYSHFGCNVVHEDIAYPLHVDAHAQKMEFKHAVEQVCGGRLPAEHGHGTEYVAPEETKKRWREMDPSNCMNPGIGGLSCAKDYKEE